LVTFDSHPQSLNKHRPQGYTELTIVPTSNELRTLHLHCRQCHVHAVTVSQIEAEFVHYDPITNLSNGASEPKDCHNHPEMKRRLYGALQESDEGELSIAIPPGVSFKQSGQDQSFGSLFNDMATPEPQTPGTGSQQLPGVEFAPVTVHIEYSLSNPVDGFQFVIPSDSYPYRVPHAYTTPSSPDAARCWVPCIDNLWEKSTWEFQFIVPRYLEDKVVNDEDDEGDENSGVMPTLVVCSGELVEQIAHPYSSGKTIFVFSQAVPTSVQHIAFAAGPFHYHPIPLDIGTDEINASQPIMQTFCLPGYEQLLATLTSFLRSAMNFYTTECGSYPFGSYKMVTVEELPVQRFDSASLSLFTTDLLHGDDAIEQAIETRQALSHALACQWVGINIVPKTWSDTWLVNGLGIYITGLFLRKLLGNNDYRYRMKKDMQRVLERDNGSMPPICQPQILDPPDTSVLPFVNLKSPLVLHILDRRLTKSGTSLGLSRVLPKVFLSALSGEMPQNALSTHAFLRTCRKVSGVDPRSFAEQWIYGSGCPSFGFSASFNRKKMAVEITMKQEAPAYKAMEGNDVSILLYKPVPFFEGQMTIRIHEADGTPYEHVLDIRSPFKRYEVPFNTKYKRVRRNTKRYLARQAAAQAAAEGDSEAAEAMGMIDMGFGLDIWENAEEREHWRVADWTEEDEATMNGATYEWIRMDADFEWIANIGFEQPDFMWVSQLQRDRDVVAQLEAVNALAKQPTAIVSSTLTKTVLVSNYYYRIRCEAALALVNCAVRKLDFLGLFHLFKLFLRYCYEPEDPNQDLFAHSYVPTPNDFSDIPEYFVRKSLVNAISRVRFENGKTPAVVRQFLIEQLRYNDNTANPFSDGYYICTLISAAGCATVSTSAPERGELLPSEVRSHHTEEDANLVKQALAEVDRYRSMDRLIPSTHNIVSVAALEFYVLMSLASLIPSDPRLFFPLTREGNYTQVRIAAFDGLFLTKWYSPPVMLYVLSVMANDPSRVIRRHVARCACQSLALLFSMGEMKASLKDNETLLIEEDGNNAAKSKEPRKTEVDGMIKALRKDREIGKNEVLREFLMPVALAPDVDHEVRWCLLKLADILIRGVEERAPTVKIHIPPPTPIQEAFVPPVVASTRIALKPSRSIKLSGPALKKALPETPSAPPKLKIPGHPSINLPRTPATPREGTPISIKSKLKLPKPKQDKPVIERPPADRPATTKAQAAGMSANDLRASRAALKKIKLNKHSQLFLQPVDPIRDHAPNYFDIIKQPMDISTMGAKLEAGHYKDRFAFEADFRLMILNAQEYNTSGSYAYNEALALKSFFDQTWSRINKTLAKHVPQPLPPPIKPLRPIGTPIPGRRTPSITSTPAPKPAPAATPSITPAPTRPLIKLKVVAKPTPKEKDKGTPLPRPPPPPPERPPTDDIDDDLLQEVIAIEQEKQKHKVHTSRESSSGAKRKKVEAISDDDIMALATPSKREKPTNHIPNGNRLKAPPMAKVSAPTPVIKVRDRPKESAPTTPVAPSKPVAQPLPQKGKNKAPHTPSSTPESRRATPSSQPVSEKKVRDILKVLQRLPEYLIFSRPVDPVMDGCPTYLDEIKHPMDFGTMGQKLTSGKYVTMEEVNRDAQLVFSNCRNFNPPGTYPCECADAVERVWKKEWVKATEKKLSFPEKRGLQGLLTTVVKDPLSWVFREPVDPVALNIPTYFDVIPRKDARDLKLIRTKLDADKYDSIEAFEADIALMVKNAIVFNGASSEVGIVAAQLQDRVSDLLDNLRAAQNKKRKEGEKPNPQPHKKIKLV
jgi:transcription initiation factor TFIID subunit 2